MQVVGKKYGTLLVLAYIVDGAVATLVWRNQTILIAIENHRLHIVVVLYCLLHKLIVVSRERLEVDVEAKLARAAQVGAELHGCVLVPVGNMRTHGLSREELRQTPLYVDALIWVGIVRTPKLCEVLQHLIIHSSTTARAKHHRKLRILVVDACEHIVYATHMVDVEVALVLLVIGRVDIGNDAIAVPLKVSHIRILGHNAVDNAKHIILNLRVRNIEHQLVAIIISVALWLHNHPIGMLLEEFALWINHLWLNPYTKLHSNLLSISYQSWYTLRQLTLCSIPIAKTSMVVLTRILIGKPSVVEQEHIYTQVFGILHQLGKALLVEVEACVFPVVKKSEAIVHTHVHLILSSPIV